jgi:MutS domain V
MSQQSSSQKEILQIYRKNIELNETAIQKIKQKKSVLAIARLTVVLAALYISWYFWPSAGSVVSAIILFTIIFIFLVFHDADQTTALKNHERLIRVNRHELDAIQQNLHGYDGGQSFAEPDHAYAADMDLFGPASLFQYLSRCHADQSKRLLADFLKTPLRAHAIRSKQAAVRELSEMQKACQRFQSLAMANPLVIKTEERIKQLMDLPSGGFEKPFWKWLRSIYPVVSLAILALFMFDYFSVRTFVFCMIGFYGFSYLISRKIVPVFELLSRIQPEIDSLHQQLQLIEREKFTSSFLISLQNRLKPAGYTSASVSIGDFNNILKKFDFRLNLLVTAFVNPFLLWDLRQMISLNGWKKRNQAHLHEWIEVIAEMEVLISLASLVYNEPGWCFPEVDEKYFNFRAEDMGHPLIPAATRVTNDFVLEGTGKIALVTGSNMAGKSTFLRTLGINTVLAGMGAPVCARRMNLCELKLISSMRVADNLAENTSTFYAELKKLQYVIESVNRKDPVFILLDEVLRGTNSTDRHKGSQALLRQLLQSGTVAVMATHDRGLALSESAANESVFNYHFEGKIIQDELYFDYKIKKGVCESLNATTLMKKIGIHFQD